MPDSKKHQKNCGDSIKDRGFHALPPEIMTEVYYCACDQARHDSLQLRVLGFSLLQDGDVGIGVFPESEEVLVGDSGFLRVACHHVGPTQLEMRKSGDWLI